jgi:SSS family solute:Na+ symporter
MWLKVMVLLVYAVGVFGVGWYARSRWSASPENFFLADRGLGPVVFLFTMAATNFSAFTVFGASGAGYRDGYAFFPLVGFGTGFMALTFWFIGRKARDLGRGFGSLTPPDLIRSLYANRGVSTLMAAVMIVYTIPYLALQPLAAGYALEELLGLDHLYGAAGVTVIICAYTLRGGLRAVALTDAFQGLLMLVVLTAALFLIAGEAGGLGQAGRTLLERRPDLFSRPGGQGKYLAGIWFSYIFLWFFCDPMFPQLFQRFLAARDDRVIRRTIVLYPLVCSVVFLLPITIGVLGHLSHPDLAGKAADRILPLLASDLGSPALGALIIACGLAALMSTMDSQLLTLSSMFSQDVLPLFRRDGRPTSAWPGRVFVVVLAGAGLALAVNPPGTILAIARQAFTGLAVLFPTVIFGLYPGWKSTPAAVASILAGQGALILDFAGRLPTGPFLAVVPVMGTAFGVYLIAAWWDLRRRNATPPGPAFFKSPYFWAFLAVFILAHDFWRWHRLPELLWGWPVWMFYFLALSAAQMALTARWTRPGRRNQGEPRT